MKLSFQVSEQLIQGLMYLTMQPSKQEKKVTHFSSII